MASGMDERTVGGLADERATRNRVVRGALRQAGRHERALEACLSELTGTGQPSLGLAAFVLRRARLHADRASGLAATATRLNRDGLAVAWLAAAVERQERNTLRVARWSADPPGEATVSERG